MAEYRGIAVDIGASGGRVMVGKFDGRYLTTAEIHRFLNEPVELNGTLYWDFLRLFHEVKIGLAKSKKEPYINSIGIDTWGVDFGFLDKDGILMENPVHYRDKRTSGTLNECFQRMDKGRLYELTGIQFMEINTVYQLYSIAKNRPAFLSKAEQLLFIPDLFHFYLSGVNKGELSIASTSQLLVPGECKWEERVFDCLSLPKRIMPEIIPAGSKLGKLRETICNVSSLKQTEVVAVAAHDTQSAMVGIPAKDEDFIFISCGTWSLFGTELNKPIMNQKALQYNLTNETGYNGRISFLKNITGLWIVQECRRQWSLEGKEYSYGHLESMALLERSLHSYILPDAPEFQGAGNMPEKIRTFCKRTGQKVPSAEGEIIRCINESLALSYRNVLLEIMECTGKEYKHIHMVGGGIRSRLLCQMTADVCNLTVIAGPDEATIFGNLGVQLIAAGYASNLEEVRSIIRESVDITIYEPRYTSDWKEANQYFTELRSKFLS